MLNSSLTAYRSANDAGMNEHTGQVDLIYPFDGWSVEGGMKGIFRKHFSDYITSPSFDISDNGNLDYHQNVLSIYNSYNFKVFKLDFKVGVRLETTLVQANFSDGTAFEPDYTNVLPSLIIEKKTKIGSLRTSYNQRIQRPGISDLNPFRDRSDNLFVNTGNIDLRPSVFHNIDLGYSKYQRSSSINLSAYYNFSDNVIQKTSRVVHDTLIVVRPENTGRIDKFGQSISYGLNMKNINLSLHVQTIFVDMRGAIDDRKVTNSGFQGNAHLYLGYQFKKGYRSALNLGYNTREIFLQGTRSDGYTTSFSVTKALFENAARITFTLNNPWTKYYQRTTTVHGSDFYQRSYTNAFNGMYSLAFSWNFGNLRKGLNRNQRRIDNSDIVTEKTEQM